jgi:hypothetical protein
MIKIRYLATAVAVAVSVAACSPSNSAPASSSSQSAAPASSAPAALTWQIGGAYTGPVPPTWPLPGFHGGIRLAPYADSRGYTSQVTIQFGVPLHYAIPQDLINCNTAYPGRSQDLDPGYYVIPFTIQVHNLTGQQSPALIPAYQVNTGTDSSSNQIQVTGIDNYDNSGVWSGGACSEGIIKYLGAGGSASLSGFIGPATPADLANAWITMSWDPNGTPVLHRPLAGVLPHKASSWLIARS